MIMKKIVLFFAATTLCVGCQSELEQDVVTPSQSNKVVVNVGFDGQETRMGYDATGSTWAPYWENGDCIGGWSSDSQSATFAIFSETSLEEGESSASASFEGDIAGSKIRFVAPYGTISADMSCEYDLSNQEVDPAALYANLSKSAILMSDELTIASGSVAEECTMKHVGSIINLEIEFSADILGADAAYVVDCVSINGLSVSGSLDLASGVFTPSATLGEVYVLLTSSVEVAAGETYTIPVAIPAQTLDAGAELTFNASASNDGGASFITMYTKKTLNSAYSFERAAYHTLSVVIDEIASSSDSVDVTLVSTFEDITLNEVVSVEAGSYLDIDAAISNATTGFVPESFAVYSLNEDSDYATVFDATSTAITEPITLYIEWGMKDATGNLYPVVKIGDDYWIAQNLRSRHYADGTELLYDESSTCTTTMANAATEGVAAGSGPTIGWEDATVVAERALRTGYLYNWWAASDEKNICPAGWHVATSTDFANLGNSITYPTGHKIATDTPDAWGVSLWLTAGTTAAEGSAAYDCTLNNESGFDLYPNVTRNIDGWFGTYNGINNNPEPDYEARLWNADQESDDNGYTTHLNGHVAWLNYKNGIAKGIGLPTRCVRD